MTCPECNVKGEEIQALKRHVDSWRDIAQSWEKEAKRLGFTGGERSDEER